MKKLTKRQFDQALRKGHGRALMHVIDYGVGEYRDVLAKACLNNYTYDRQVEGERSEYLGDLIAMTEKPSYFWKLVGNNITKCDNEANLSQMAALSYWLIKDGAEFLLPLLYEHYERVYKQFSNCWIMGKTIIDIDDLKGLTFVFKTLAKYSPSQQDTFGLYSDVCDEIGFEKVNGCLEKLSGKSVWLQNFLKESKEEYKKIEDGYYARKIRRKRKRMSLAEFLDLIESDKSLKSGFFTFGRFAQPDELLTVYKKLKRETNSKNIWRYLKAFQEKPLPQLGSFAFELARSQTSEVKVRLMSFTALSNSCDRRIRNFAIKTIQDDPDSIFFGVLELFKKNYREGDCTLILNSLFVHRKSHWTHRAVCDLVDIMKSTGSKELIDCALWAYEKSPCTFCREKIVVTLSELQILPENLLEEGMYDCNEYLRDFCKELIKSRENQENKP